MCLRLLLGYTSIHIIVKTVFLRAYVIEPRESPRGFVLETYFIVESELANRLRRQNNDVKEYIELVVGVVSQILKQLDPPGTVALRGIEIKTPENDHAAFMRDGIVDAPKTLGNIESYVQMSTVMRRADLVVYLVGRDMEHRRPDGSVFVSYGLAYTNGACTKHNAVVVADNQKKYTGSMAVAHEIGHLLGSSHDGSQYAPECPSNGGTIMIPQAVGEVRARFSNCSKEAISKFVRTRAKCLFQESDPIDTTTAKEVPTITETPSGVDDEKHKKKMRNKCHQVLSEGYSLLDVEMDDKNVTCNVLCTAASAAAYEVMYYAVVAPNGIPCDKSDPVKVCKRGYCI